MVRAVPHLLLGQGIISLQDARGAQEPSKQGAPCCAQCLASFWVAGSPACRKWSVHRKHQTYGVWPILLERVLAHHITSLQKARGVGSAPEEAKKIKTSPAWLWPSATGSTASRAARVTRPKAKPAKVLQGHDHHGKGNRLGDLSAKQQHEQANGASTEWSWIIAGPA